MPGSWARQVPRISRIPRRPGLIDRTVPGAKVIASLRDPVERLHSHYLMMLNNRPGMGSFMDEVKKGLALQYDRSLAVLGPDVGLYYQQVRRYREVFGDARFKVLIFEETMSDVPAALRGVLEFLGIEHDLANFDAPAQRQYSEARGPIVRYLFGNRFISRSAEALVPYRLRKLVRNTILGEAGGQTRDGCRDRVLPGRLLRRGRPAPGGLPGTAAAVAELPSPRPDHPDRRNLRRLLSRRSSPQ